MASSDLPSGRQSGRGLGRHVALIAIVTGIVTGALVTAIAAYRIIWGEAIASVIFVPIIAIIWSAVAVRIGRRTDSLATTVITMALSGVLTAVLGAVADYYFSHAFIDTWVRNTNVALQATTQDSVTADQLLGRELGYLIMSTVIILVASGVLGLIGGLIGVGSADPYADEAEPDYQKSATARVDGRPRGDFQPGEVRSYGAPPVDDPARYNRP